MTRILKRLPILPDRVIVRGSSYQVKNPQIIVWVSLGLPDQEEWDPRLPRIPAILDTGNSRDFFLTENQLARWAGFAPASLRQLGHTRVTDIDVPQRHARLFLHRNIPGERDRFDERPPHLLSLDSGIAVCRDDHSRAPRLSLLGLRALLANKLILTIDGTRNCINLCTASPWWWPF